KLQGMDARIHHLGTPTSSDPVVLAPGKLIDRVEFPGASYSPVSTWVLGAAGGAHPNHRPLAARLKDVLAGKPNWTQIATYWDQVNADAVRGDYLYVQTTRRVSNAELIRVDLRHPSLDAAEVVLPESDLVLAGVFATTDGVYVEAMKDSISHLIFLPDGH